MKPLKNLWAAVLILLIIAGCNSDQSVLNTLDTYEDNAQKETPWAHLEPGDPIPGQYIVVFSDDMDFSRLTHTRAVDRAAQMSQIASDFMQEKGMDQREIPYAYHSSIRGFTSDLEPDEIAILENDPRIAYVEQDRIVGLAGKPENPGNGNGNNNGGGNGGGEDPPPPPQITPWNITRVNGGVSYTGTAVAWIIDSGIDMDNPDLNIDASRGFTAFHNSNGKKWLQDEGNHGTPVAGVIGAIDNNIGIVGVAAGVTVIPVRVFDAGLHSSVSAITAGVDWVAANGTSGDVANMSIQSTVPLPTIDNAVLAAASQGIIFSLAAGNHGVHADNSSPGRVNGPGIYTISGMDSLDIWRPYNYGNPPIDYCAPASGSITLYNDGTIGPFGGTSIAAPHAAGVLLLGAPKIGGYVIGDPDGNPDPIIVH